MSSFRLRSALCLAGLLDFAAGNFISPGLGKCMDIKAALKADGTRETVSDMKKSDKPINVQLYTCHDQHNQQFQIVGGTIKSTSLGRCVTATKAEANANVELTECKDGDKLQQWDLTEYGYARLLGTDQCIDVVAALKKDGTRENWNEIKSHTTVNVHLYNCHDPTKTKRVNQLWQWAAVKGDKGALCGVEQAWTLRDDMIPKASNTIGATTLAVAMAGVVGSVFGGLVVSRMAQRKPAVGQADLEMLTGE